MLKLARAKKPPKALLRAMDSLNSGDGASSAFGGPRVIIPKSQLSLSQMKANGFSSSMLAIPEPGQAKWVSYRHPDRYHAHDHGKVWVMHRDDHNPLSGLRDTVTHVVDEGIPATKHYVKWVRDRKGDVVTAIKEDLRKVTR